MRKIVSYSIKQRIFYNLLFVVIIVVGFVSIFNVPIERYPNYRFGKVLITTTYPGASPVDVESLVTKKIEEVLETVDGIDWIESTSSSGQSLIRIKFVDDSDYDALYDEVRLSVLNITNELPSGIDPPVLRNVKVQDLVPVTMINLMGDHNNRTLSLIGEQIKKRLQKISHVQHVDYLGKQTQEFHVLLDPQKLREFGVSFNQVSHALSSTNLSLPAGRFKNNNGQYLIKLDERFNTISQVGETIVRKDADGSLVRVTDLTSHIGMGYRDPVMITSINGKPSLALKVIKSEHGNAIDIRNQVTSVLQKMNPTLQANGVEAVITMDSTVYINDGLNTLGLNMIVGIILVALIVWYFMGWRNASLITIGIPFSYIITVVIIHITGNSLNELTLFSLVLVTGIIVDDAIVVTENIYRHLYKGSSLRSAIVNGTSEVALPVISATLTTAAAFLPLLIMTGSTGQFFALVPKIVTFAIIASLVECLLILPVHYYDYGPRIDKNNTKQQQHVKKVLKIFKRVTYKVLKVTLRYRMWSVLTVSGLFAISVAILMLSSTGKLSLLRIQFFPDDYKTYYIDVIGPSNTNIESIDERVKHIAQTVMDDGPGMANAAMGLAGVYFNEDYEAVNGNNHGTVMVTMPSLENQTFIDPLKHLQRMRKKLKPLYEVDGYKLNIHPQSDGPPRGKDINVRIAGTDLTKISEVKSLLQKFIRESPEINQHLVDFNSDQGQPKRVFRMHIKHDRVSEYGLDTSEVTHLAASAIDGRYLDKYRNIDHEVDLKLQIDPRFLQNPESALYIPVIEDSQNSIYLADLVKVETYQEPKHINRFQGQRVIRLLADLRDGAAISTPVIVSLIKNYFNTIQHQYPEVTISFGGEHEDTRKSFESLAYAFIIALLLMYIILATQFQSYLQPLIILSAVVFAMIGVVFGKVITQSLFTVNSFIAMIGVAGVVVNDSLVLIHFLNKRYRKGLNRREAIILGIKVRIRPILLTTLTTTLGLLPMAIGFPSYSIVWGSMASTFVTGLATATLLTLFIVPVFWDLLQELQEKYTKQPVHKIKDQTKDQLETTTTQIITNSPETIDENLDNPNRWAIELLHDVNENWAKQRIDELESVDKQKIKQLNTHLSTQINNQYHDNNHNNDDSNWAKKLLEEIENSDLDLQLKNKNNY